MIRVRCGIVDVVSVVMGWVCDNPSTLLLVALFQDCVKNYKILG